EHADADEDHEQYERDVHEHDRVGENGIDHGLSSGHGFGRSSLARCARIRRTYDEGEMASDGTPGRAGPDRRDVGAAMAPPARTAPHDHSRSAHRDPNGTQDPLLDVHHPARREASSERAWRQVITSQGRDLLALGYGRPWQASFADSEPHVSRRLAQDARDGDYDHVARQPVATVRRDDQGRPSLAAGLVGDVDPVDAPPTRIRFGDTHSPHPRR